jgi:putative hydrolase of the HAD superfamily
LINVVFFDVGGTLIHAHPSVGAIYSAVAARHGVDAPPEILNERFEQAWRPAKKVGNSIEKAWWRDLVKKVFEPYKVPDGDAFFNDLYDSFRDPASWRIYPDVLETLNELHNRGIRLAIASNWDERLPGLLTALDLTRHFEKMFISYEVGFAKPDKLFFLRALAGMKADPIESAHVGDDPEEDIRGAESAGMRAYLINRKKKPINSRMMSDLTEILLRL